MTRKLLLGLLVVLVLTPQASATEVFEKVGTVGCQFLEIGAGPRGVGMGEAMVSATEGVESVYWNPAGLRSIVRPTALFSYGTWPADISHQFAAYAMRPTFIRGVVAVSVTTLQMDPMLVRTADTPGGVGVQFDAGDIAIGLTYAREFTDKFSAGGTLKWVHSGLADLSPLGVEGLEDYTVEGFAGDFGTLYNTGFRSLQIGLMIQNMGPEVTYVAEPVPMPMTFKFGISMNLIETPGQLVKVAAEFRHPADTSEKVNVGAEYALNDMYFVRAGYKMGYDEESFTAGGGARLTVGTLGNLGVDYSYAAFGYFGGIHRAGVSVEFGGIETTPAPRPRTEPEYTCGISNTVDWYDVTCGDPVSYSAEVSTTPDFSSTMAGSGWISGTEHEFKGLSDGNTYYFRVKARCSGKPDSPWSRLVQSTQDDSPPTTLAGDIRDQYDSQAFAVSFEASDAGSGVDYVELWYRRDEGTPERFGDRFTTSPVEFTADGPGTYEFYTVGVDAVGNTEVAPAVADCRTVVAEVTPRIAWEDVAKRVHFEFRRYEIPPEYQQPLQDFAAWLVEPTHEDVRLLIEGHCDERGTNEYNMALGERRALAVKSYLAAHGVAVGRIETISYGEEHPVDPGHDDEAWATNRRASFVQILE